MCSKRKGCFFPWCGVGDKYCVDCSAFQSAPPQLFPGLDVSADRLEIEIPLEKNEMPEQVLTTNQRLLLAAAFDHEEGDIVRRMRCLTDRQLEEILDELDDAGLIVQVELKERRRGGRQSEPAEGTAVAQNSPSSEAVNQATTTR